MCTSWIRNCRMEIDYCFVLVLTVGLFSFESEINASIRAVSLWNSCCKNILFEIIIRNALTRSAAILDPNYACLWFVWLKVRIWKKKNGKFQSVRIWPIEKEELTTGNRPNGSRSVPQRRQISNIEDIASIGECKCVWLIIIAFNLIVVQIFPLACWWGKWNILTDTNAQK